MKGLRHIGYPCDLYLEGSDQHRGWFQLSLLAGLAATGISPFKTVLTHGFMLDGDGRAMHKSAGNVISPASIQEKYGADIIRLWVASENFREDVRLSHTILDQVADTYRNSRNTWRFLPGTIDDLDRITAYAKNAKRAAVMGGGLLGLEVARAVVDLGLDTHVVESAPHLMSCQLDEAGARSGSRISPGRWMPPARPVRA